LPEKKPQALEGVFARKPQFVQRGAKKGMETFVTERTGTPRSKPNKIKRELTRKIITAGCAKTNIANKGEGEGNGFRTKKKKIEEK